jgi:hypothetical protein
MDWSYREKFWKANFLKSHGAMFFAIIAVSIGIVQLPQNTS